jgi:thioredoxin reductase
MRWLLAAMGVVGGSTIAASRSIAHASEAPRLDAVMDPSNDVKPMNLVVVGGGYAGGKLAYQFDSIFSTTLIDTKNYEEITADIIPIFTNPWNEKNDEACRKLHVLHRYYLKRANVLTAKAVAVKRDCVVLEDGRMIPYDVLMVANGEEKAFPFATTQKTISGRVAELKAFNQFLSTTKKIAIVGGGPMGVSLAARFAEDRPEIEVHLFHAQDALLPALPDVASQYAYASFAEKKSVNLHLCTNVVNLKSNATVQPQHFWDRLLKRPVVQTVGDKFSVFVERLQYHPVPPQSILSQSYFGRRKQARQSDVISSEWLEDFDYVFNVGGDTPRPISYKPECMLSSHLTPDGHYRVSSLMQLFGLPHVFASGRCTNLPGARTLGSSDLESRTIFRMLNGIINSSQEKTLRSSDGIRVDRLEVPRLLLQLGSMDACGSTPWSGAITGLSALREFIQDRGHFQREFSFPVFYKQQDPQRVRTRIDNWKSQEMTDITDFSHANA